MFHPSLNSGLANLLRRCPRKVTVISQPEKPALTKYLRKCSLRPRPPRSSGFGRQRLHSASFMADEAMDNKTGVCRFADRLTSLKAKFPMIGNLLILSGDDGQTTMRKRRCANDDGQTTMGKRR